MPALDEQPARLAFEQWLEGGGAALASAARESVAATGIGDSFTQEIVASLFKEG